jgi:hypothetical protein
MESFIGVPYLLLGIVMGFSMGFLYVRAQMAAPEAPAPPKKEE